MKISFELFDSDNKEQVDILYDWELDPELFKLITPIFKKEDQAKLPDKETFKSKYKKNDKWIHEIQVVCVDGIPVGNFSLMMDPGHLFKKVEGTAWLGLTIAERDYWGKGVAEKALQKFELRAKFYRAVRAELGVFEFNTRAIKFYQKQGYREIGRIERFTWADDKQWDDIRMEKIF